MSTLIAASHGTDNSDGAAAISALVSEVQKVLPDIGVYEAFVDVQDPDVPAVLAAAGSAEPAIVVPLLLATGYHVRQDIADATFAAGSHTQITPALGPDERLVEVLVERLEQVGHQSDDLVILTVAGSSDSRAQAESQLVQLMLEAALGKKVELAFLSAAEPKLKDLVPKLKFQNPRKRVVVATYLLAEGYFAGVAKKVGAHLVSEPLLVNGAPVPQQLVEIIVDRFMAATDATNPRTTGCLSGLRGEPWVGCAAGCASACR
jgi:sirohydrochlorin ferrochelatase